MKRTFILIAASLISVSMFGQNFDNEVYFRAGYSNPSWSQFGFTENEWNNETFDKKAGVVFEFGSIFMINRILKAENMALGINADYLYINYNNFSSSKNEDNFGNIRFGSKIGPSFTYVPIKKLALDVYAKVDFAWATAAVRYVGKVDDADDYYLGNLALGFSTGINIRYSILMLGIEFNTISPELESDDYPGEYLGNMEDDSNKSPLPCLNFTLGLSF